MITYNEPIESEWFFCGGTALATPKLAAHWQHWATKLQEGNNV